MRIGKFDNFDKISESVNEGKYDNTFYDNIMTAKFMDAQLKKYKRGASIDMRYGPYAEDQIKKYTDSSDTVPFQRQELQDNIAPDKDWSKVPDREIIRTMNDLRTRIMQEKNNSIAINKIDKELDRLKSRNSISVQAHARTPDDLIIKFVRPIFTTQENLKDALEFLKRSEKIEVSAQPRVVNQWEVEYSGHVKNDKGEGIEFKDVNNGLAVNLN
jgi:hypothetical protein